ncbi:MAG: deoxyribodipyrimidine photo-lyase [Vampirovibrionales bacterium]|nr:deoxyribodipyrimidine photo-lyase [Vampirovibrionales bacterium]
MADAPIILWFRQDFRLSDHPALTAACQTACAVIPVYIWDEEAEGGWPLGAASKVWLKSLLEALQKRLLKDKGNRLYVFSGDTQIILEQLLKTTGAQAVYAQRRYEPAARKQDEALQKSLQKPFKLFEGGLLHQPEAYLNKQGGPYQVYTPFSKMLFDRLPQISPLPEPATIPALKNLDVLKSLEAMNAKGMSVIDIDSLPLLPANEPDWHSPMMNYWDYGRAGHSVGEGAAQERLQKFIKQAIGDYETARNIPSIEGTSALSPYLHFGEISPAQVWQAIHEAMPREKVAAASAHVFLKELLWREFTHHMLYHFPKTQKESLRAEFRQFPWQSNPGNFKAWQQGQTGYPLVDAGMRQLWATGWMHNRVRMVVGSFLVKNLLISWQEGAAWFWDTLVDADLAQNSFNWQWVGGCGADAAPYFRVFNPVLQGEKFDPDGAYIRRWVPELAALPAKWIHRPWDAPQEVLEKAKLPSHSVYRNPIVDHISTRDKALAAYKSIRKTAASG